MSGAERDLQGWLERADELAAEGRYFDAHEELEAGWMRASGGEKVLLQGLIQVAAGLHRLRNDPAKTDGAMYLLERGGKKLREQAALLDERSLAALEAELDKMRAYGQAPASMRFGLRRA